MVHSSETYGVATGKDKPDGIFTGCGCTRQIAITSNHKINHQADIILL